MTLKKNGPYWYGTEAGDTRAEVERYSGLNGHRAVKFAQAACGCGSRSFNLATDEAQGVAQRLCTSCGTAHLMGDSSEWVDGASWDDHECACSGKAFELCVGVALYDGSNDARWYYLGCRCTQCRLVGVFADWKCEAGDADALLANT